MRDIVATIAAEQDVVIRAPLDTCLVVQGGPGTGKTAVGLHRAAFLLFEHREQLDREGVLVVGPNPLCLQTDDLSVATAWGRLRIPAEELAQAVEEIVARDVPFATGRNAFRTRVR